MSVETLMIESEFLPSIIVCKHEMKVLKREL
jgi:hypothetical protein